MSSEKKTRVCVRGISGLLGKRLARAITKNPDIEVTAGVVRNDETLDRFLKSPLLNEIKPHQMYMDEPHRTVSEANRSQSLIEFAPADQLKLSDVCDVVVDTTAGGSRAKWDEKYEHFGKSVIIQSGEYPYGRLFAPPLMAKGSGNVYRLSDCILSGLTPLLAPFKNDLVRAKVHILMQYGERLHDYPTSQRVNATYIRDDLAAQIREELASFFDMDKRVDILQVPGLDYYIATVYFSTPFPMSGHDIREKLSSTPRVSISPADISSTYQIDHLLREEAQSCGRDYPPITVFGCDMDDGAKKYDNHRLRACLYSRLVAVLPNIDAIRSLATGMDPLESMGITDRNAGFYTQTRK